MKSIKYLYKIGRGPSSSHTMAPEWGAKYFMANYPADRYKVVLFGSLAATGKGHGTDRVLETTMNGNVEVVFDTVNMDIKHPNTMDFYAYKNGAQIAYNRMYSIGGGAVSIEGVPEAEPEDIYPHHTFNEIKKYCEDEDIRLCDYVVRMEGNDILDYFGEVWEQMKQTITEGLKAKGILPGGLGVTRKAKLLFNQKHIDESPETRENRIVCAYAYAASEQNADGGVMVTAPTCGASGVVPSVFKYMQDKKGFKDDDIIRGLATAGLIGNIIKSNASISGAECGCQAEIGSACSMAAAGLAELFGMDINQIEYAAEVAMEHHLGLTCDPISGLVQIPCIERNAVAAMRAINAFSLANFLTNTRKISFDMVVETMYETGRDLNKLYRETSKGGLAKLYGDTSYKLKE